MWELRVVQGEERGRSWSLGPGERVVVGRGNGCEVRLEDGAMSREHFALVAQPDGWTLVDLVSHNGTFVNGQRLRGEQPLRHMDLISAGRHRLAILEKPSAAPTEVIEGPSRCTCCGCQLDPSIEAALGLVAAGPTVCAICRQLGETQPHAPPGSPALSPQAIGPFQLHQPLGAGSGGTVYKAWDTREDRWLALKLLIPREVSGMLIRRFLEESRIIASLDHPGIVRCLDLGQVQQMLYIAMEYVEGRDLEALLGDEPLPGAGRAVDWGVALCEALHHAHQQGVIHRDLKPANILINQAGRPKIIDFGLSRTADRSGLRLTQSCTFLGTPQYMSPEQIDNVKEVDRRTDIYAVGVILYRLFSGVSPFTTGRRDLAALYRAKAAGQVRPLEEFGLVPPALGRVVAGAMAPDVEDRYASAAELADALRRATPDHR